MTTFPRITYRQWNILKAAIDGYAEIIREGMGTEHDFKADPDWQKYADACHVLDEIGPGY